MIATTKPSFNAASDSVGIQLVSMCTSLPRTGYRPNNRKVRAVFRSRSKYSRGFARLLYTSGQRGDRVETGRTLLIGRLHLKGTSAVPEPTQVRSFDLPFPALHRQALPLCYL